MNISAISNYTSDWSQVSSLSQTYGASGVRKADAPQPSRSLPSGGFQDLMLAAMESFNNSSATSRTERRKQKSYTDYN